MRLGLTALLSLAALALAGAAFAQDKDAVWKWVDKDGVTHYSDRPVPGAVKVDLRLQTYSPPDTSAVPPPSESRPPRTNVSYQSVRIVSPAAEEIFQGANATVQISAAVEPQLQASHRIRFEVDGQAQGQPSASTSITLREVPRGAHIVRASVLSESGAVLKQSEPITFYVQQPSILSPARRR